MQIDLLLTLMPRPVSRGDKGSFSSRLICRPEIAGRKGGMVPNEYAVEI